MKQSKNFMNVKTRDRNTSARIMFSRVLGILLAAAILIGVCGCSNNTKNPADSTTAGDSSILLYNEKEIGSNAGLKNPQSENLRINSKGHLVMYEKTEQTGKFISLDEEGKVQSEIKCDIKGYLQSYDLDEQDNIYAVVMETSEDKKTTTMVSVIDSAGKITKKIPLQGAVSDNDVGNMLVATDIAVGGNGKIYVATLKGIVVLDKSGKIEKKLGKGAYYGIDTDSESNILALSIPEGKLTLVGIDCNTGKNIWSNTEIQRSDVLDTRSVKIRFNRAKNCAYVMNSRDISSIDSNGKALSKVLQFNQYMLLTSGNSPSAMNIDQKGNLYILTAGEEKCELYRYDIPAGTHKVKERKVITLAVPYTERWLEVAALKFQKTNQEYRVEIKQYETDEKQASQGNNENYAKAINTELLTGKGPDIINTSGLPYEKYAEKNLFAELGEMMEQDSSFDKSKYYTNIFDALKYKDKYYTIPASVSFSVLAANKKILGSAAINPDDSKWTWEDISKIGQNLPKDKKMFISMSMNSLLNYMLTGNFSSFIKESEKRANFNSPEFISLLNLAKKYGDSKISEKAANGNYGDIGSIQKGSVIFNPMSINNYTGYAFMKGIYNDQVELLKFPSVGGLQGGIFDSGTLFSINNNSSNKAVAWEFLKYLLSDEIQAGDLEGFAVNKEALAKTAQKTIDMVKTGSMVLAVSSKNDKSPIVIEPKVLSQKDIDYVNSFIEKMCVYNRNNAGVNAIIDSETKSFFSGGKSAEEVANIIQNKVNIYLGE